MFYVIFMFILLYEKTNILAYLKNVKYLCRYSGANVKIRDKNHSGIPTIPRVAENL